MNLFSKEKDLIFKIANAVLVLWLVGSLTALWIATMNVIIPEEYPIYPSDCVYNETTTDCTTSSKVDTSYLENIKYDNKKQIFIIFGNFIIVGSVLYFLNRKKGK